MKAEIFVNEIKNIGINTLIGVPDSTLKQFCDYINTDGKGQLEHYTTANEGSAIGMAMGVFLANGNPSCIYMQNSGLGNIVNPITSLANKKVYDVPMLLVIGWRGEPGVKDEPQHVFMGEVTEKQLQILNINYSIIDKDTDNEQTQNIFMEAKRHLDDNLQYAIIVKKDTFEKREETLNDNGYTLVRETVIGKILENINEKDYLVSTTGKISREVYEQSDIILGQHAQHFLTVGGMGHASMIAFGIAKEKCDSKVYCIDGDGAVLMHMGSLAFIGNQKPQNLYHICLNNDSHESVGGMPTGSVGQDFYKIAEQCGYEKAYLVNDNEELEHVLKDMKLNKGPVFIEIKVSLKSREDLGRPKETAVENKVNFMNYHNNSNKGE